MVACESRAWGSGSTKCARARESHHMPQFCRALYILNTTVLLTCLELLSLFINKVTALLKFKPKKFRNPFLPFWAQQCRLRCRIKGRAPLAETHWILESRPTRTTQKPLRCPHRKESWRQPWPWPVHLEPQEPRLTRYCKNPAEMAKLSTNTEAPGCKVRGFVQWIGQSWGKYYWRYLR